MQTLSRSLRGISGKVHVPWSTLAKAISPGPGHLVLVTGSPGVGKSAFGLWWAVHMDSPALYLSLDSDLATQAARTVSMLADIPFEQVRQNVKEWESYLSVQDRTLPMMIDYPVKMDQIDEVRRAFEEFYSCTPSLIVVDNFKNVVRANTYEAFAEAAVDLTRVAKKNKTVVVALHHTNRQANQVPQLRDARFAGEDEAPFVLGLHRTWHEVAGEVLAVRINKNRFGPADYDVPLKFDFSRMQLREV